MKNCLFLIKNMYKKINETLIFVLLDLYFSEVTTDIAAIKSGLDAFNKNSKKALKDIENTLESKRKFIKMW